MTVQGETSTVTCSAAQKVILLEFLLGQIANYCPIINRNSIIRNSTSIESVWQAIRLHHGFQTTGGHFLDLADVKLENVLRTSTNVCHHLLKIAYWYVDAI